MGAPGLPSALVALRAVPGAARSCLRRGRPRGQGRVGPHPRQHGVRARGQAHGPRALGPATLLRSDPEPSHPPCHGSSFQGGGEARAPGAARRLTRLPHPHALRPRSARPDSHLTRRPPHPRGGRAQAPELGHRVARVLLAASRVLSVAALQGFSERSGGGGGGAPRAPSRLRRGRPARPAALRAGDHAGGRPVPPPRLRIRGGGHPAPRGSGSSR
jgi:hypothetical protein